MARPSGKKKISKKGLSPLACDIIDSLEEYAAYNCGEKTNVKLYSRPTNVPKTVDVKSIRYTLGMTQEQFTAFGFSLSAIRHWEAHRRLPEGAARVLLKVIERNPGIVLETLHQ